MNREIQFRAWDKYENKMKQVSSIDFTNEELWLIVENNRIMSANLFELELMQYTGIKDKNGVEVYEGNIVRFTNNYNTDVPQKIGVVKFGNASFYIADEAYSCYRLIDKYYALIQIFAILTLIVIDKNRIHFSNPVFILLY